MCTDGRKFVRGNVYYIKKFPTVGSEQKSGRPAVVVSNKANNDNSDVLEVCYLTLQRKTSLPTHVYIKDGACHGSIILCEQITSVSVDRVGDSMCTLSEDIMKEVDKALTVSLDLPVVSKHPLPTIPEYLKPIGQVQHEEKLQDELKLAQVELKTAREESALYKRMYDELIDKLIRGKA